jgi:hypothetical protein
MQQNVAPEGGYAQPPPAQQGAPQSAPAGGATPGRSTDGYAPAPSPQLQIQQSLSMHERVRGYDEQLLETLASRAPDCPVARSLRDRICDLSGRICTIADRNPSEAQVGDRCRDSRDSCTRAARDVAEACP